jgi:biotin carboxylase
LPILAYDVGKMYGEDVGRVKSIVILGASISQVPLIRTAKQMGLRTVVISRQGNYPGFAIADRAYRIDTTDAEAIVEAVKREGAQGICTTGTDVAVRALGRVTDALGLPGVSGVSAELCSDKLRMKEAFMEHGVQTAGYFVVESQHEAEQAFRKLQPPLIFKAVDCGASKGIVRVDRYDQIEYACAVIWNVTKQSYFIVEEFIDGEEFGAQAFVQNGEVQFIMPHGDLMFYGDAGVPIGHYVPYDLPEETLAAIHSTVHQSVRALQLDQCAVNADFIRKGNQVYVLEIGARAGATCLPELVSTYYGFDYYKQMILSAMGESPSFISLRRQPCACELMISGIGGTIVEMDYRGGQDPDVLDVSFDYRRGDTISAFRVGTDRIGQIIVKGDSMDAMRDKLEQVKENIHIAVAGGEYAR